MMIEQNTNYAYKLKYMDNPTFDKVRDLSAKFYRELPQALQDELFEALNRGIDILDSEPQMTAYLFAYGKMHKAKLNYAFEHLPETFFEIPEINIIDYGCGQAVATMCYADFLRKQGYEQKIRRVTLIEPSEAALKRAALHVSVFFPDAEIVTINKEFDDLKTKDIVCDEDVPTLHLLSNVLDMECFSLAAFMRLLNKTIGPSNMFVCVGPYFGEESDRSKRMDWFNENLMDDGYFVEDLDAGEFDENNSWTCMVRCFGVGDLDYSVSDEKLSTVAKAGDLWIQDKYGVVYSKDGKRLLNAHYSDFETYTIKYGIKVICGNAFLRSPLRSIVIPDSVTSIGDRAFEDCKSLQSIVIPKSVISIGVNPFVNSGIKSIVSHSKFFKADGKALYDQKKKLLIAFYSNCSHFVIPSSVTSIGNWAFYGCTALQSISIPNSVTNIGGRAFLYCESLQSIVIPNSVTNIGYEAFSSCHSLQSIFIPNSVTSIGEDAFKGCKSLQSIVIPNSVSSIGNSAFSFCTSLQSIVIPDSVTNIGDSTFRNCGSLRSINIPNSVKSIGYGAFMLCDSLQSIIIPNSVKSIGDDAFRYCESLQSIVILNSVKSIGDSAFSFCTSLQTIVIPDSVTSIGDRAFEGCKSLQSIVIPNSVTSIGDRAFEGCKSLQSIVIPNSVTSIGDRAFEGCKSFQSIVIPKNVISIGVNPFVNSGIRSIVSHSKFFKADGKALYDQKKKLLIAFYSNCSHFVIPNSVTSIGDRAFSRCKSLQSIIITESVRSIGDLAFYCCESLQSIVIPKGRKAKFRKMIDKELWDKLVEK